MNAWYSKEIDRLYLRMYPMLFEYARSILANDALAQEAVQDTFVIACQKPEALCGSPNPEGWLVKTLKNVLSNTLRTQKTAKRVLLSYFAVNSGEISFQTDRVEVELLYEDIAELEEFKLLRELALEGRSYLEMAQVRSITVDACRKRMERARKTLQNRIKKMSQDET